MDKNELQKLLDEGKTNREIGEILGYSKSNVGYWITKHGLNKSQKFYKKENYKFEKIDSIEKAYTIGFICADGGITKDKLVQVSVQLRDKAVVEFLANVINGRVAYNLAFDKKTRRFPKASTSKRIKDVSTFLGGEMKKDRHFPIANKELERYVLQGLFDADGCITWGRRKDKNRIWQKVSFTSSLKILTGVQMFLLKRLSISTIVRPKSNDDCYVIEFSNRNDVVKFIDYLYKDNDFIVLDRKYFKAKALRLELEENGEGYNK